MKKDPTARFAEHLVVRSLVKLPDVNRCLNEQKRLRAQGKKCLLGRILLREKLISQEELWRALASAGALFLRCPTCGIQKKVIEYRPENEERCDQCQAAMVYWDGTSERKGPQRTSRLKPPDPNASDTTVTGDPEKDSLINQIVGGCQITRRVARGGMGVVYEAKQLSMARTVALKVLSQELATNKSFVERFINEARSAGVLSHGNIVHINDAGADGEINYIIMEFVEGVTLMRRLRERGKLEPAEVAGIAHQAAQALNHAHRKNIIHRDIKPENIMITEEGVVKLADMGLAKRITGEEAGITQPGAIMGTPYYMAPEQAKDFRSVDERSDIYGLGATLYRALTGRVAFEGKSAIEVVMKVCEGKKKSIRELNSEVPGDLALVVEKMMHVDPEKRYQNAGELIEDLEPVKLRLRVPAGART